MASDEEHLRVKLRASMQSDVGVVRDHNEDAAYIDEGMAFFVVADGMGGHAAGEVASAMAVDSVRQALSDARSDIESFADAPDDDARQALVAVLEAAVREAHRAVFERGVAEPDKQGMGTTLDVVLVAGAEAFIAHVGDSRTYLLRDGKAAQITTDHTVAEVLVIEGKLSPEEAQVSPLRTILVNAIGVAPEVGVEMAHVRLRQGDRLLLSSDGLHDYFPTDEEIAERAGAKEPDASLVDMVELAKDRGGSDNITGVLFEVLEAPPPTPEEEAAGATSPHAAPDAVPQEISRDDTMPVDAGRVLGRRATARDPETNDDHDDASGDGDADEHEALPDSRPTLRLQVKGGTEGAAEAEAESAFATSASAGDGRASALATDDTDPGSAVDAADADTGADEPDDEPAPDDAPKP